MALFEWNDSMSIGIDIIDKDHKVLVNLLNLLHDAVADGQGKETTGSVLNSLSDYTEYHFSREEVMLRACNYPDLERHIKAHDSLKARVNEVRRDYEQGDSADIDHYVLEFLKDWLQAHIIGRDKLYQACMKEHIGVVEKASRAFSENPDWSEPDIDKAAGLIRRRYLGGME